MSDNCPNCHGTEVARAAPEPRDAASADGTRDLRLRIENMDCPTEEALIRKALAAAPGVEELQFDLMNRVLRVVHRLEDPAPVISTLARIGMQATVLEPGPPSTGPSPGASAPVRHAMSGKRIGLVLGGVAAIAAEAVSYATGAETAWPVVALALAALALCGPSTIRKGWTALATFTLNINLLMSVAVIGAMAIGQWPEAAVVIWLFAVAEEIEAASLDRARNAIRALMALAPERANVRQSDGSWSEVDSASVPHGAIVRVRPGERIALDGVVVAGESSVDQAPITGESMPVAKSAGEGVFAGTINGRGALEIRVTASRGETTLDRIARTVQEAQGQRAPTQRFVDRFARIYTPAVFVVAVGVALVPPLAMAATWPEWIYRALVLLVIACPCALVISTPVTIVSALAAAARRGVVVKGGLYLERAGKLASIAFDKTGTLTLGKPVVTDIIPLDGNRADEVLDIAASLEARSEHPLGAAIVAARGVKALDEVAGFMALPGRGVRGRIGDAVYHVGNHRLAEELRLCGPAVEAVLDRLEEEAKTAVVVAAQDRVLGVIGVADRERETSAAVVARLKELGVRSIMLTGDNARTARAVASRVGIDEARAELLPEGKLEAIGELAARGPVGMVGDGVNDAPALARADVGFVMGAGGTDVAMETADVALMQDDLHKLPEFIRLSRRTRRVLAANIALALGIKAVVFVLTLAGYGTLWMAVFADMGASLLVVFNGLRLLADNGGAAASG